MYKLSEDISKSAFFYEFTKKIGFSNLPRYRSKAAICKKSIKNPIQVLNVAKQFFSEETDITTQIAYINQKFKNGFP
jgi:predicted lactoylglutathione lyase